MSSLRYRIIGLAIIAVCVAAAGVSLARNDINWAIIFGLMGLTESVILGLRWSELGSHAQ